MELLKEWKENIDLYQVNKSYYLKRTDGKTFGIHETIYSNVDLELSFSFEKQSTSKLDCKDLFWIYKDEKRIAGVHICPNLCGSFFMSTDSVNKSEVISIISSVLKFWSDENVDIRIYGVLSDTINEFKKYGFIEKSARKVMIRPTEKFDLKYLNERFTSRVARLEDVEVLGRLMHESYTSSVDYKVFGQQTLEEATKDAKYILETYASNNTLDASTLVYDKYSQQLVGACIAGISGYCDHDFSEIGELVVHPHYRRLGLAAHLIKRALSELKQISPASILCVTSGNPAERIYKALGFHSGKEFTTLYLPKKTEL